ncbi:MAG: hypothetical protein R2706_19090 [Acidimicrobiales bacterium]
MVRKQPKGRGTDRYVEGASLEGKRILLVDDVITTSGSRLVAKERIDAEGGIVVLASTLVARSDTPQATFDIAGHVPTALHLPRPWHSRRRHRVATQRTMADNLHPQAQRVADFAADAGVTIEVLDY